MHDSTTPRDWSWRQKLAFRFALIYFVLYALPLPTSVWTPLVAWVGTTLVGLPMELFHIGPTGSGDTSFKVLRTATILVLAVLGSLLWSMVDRKRRHHRSLLWWLTVGARTYLAWVMIDYGFAKVFRLQFQDLRFERLLTPYGDSSPMGLVWTFMGASKAYTVFSGLGEVIGGVLVFFRRTMTLGALVVIAVMTNVLMLNLSYDIPVKLFSFHLLLLAVILAATDYRRLANVLVFNRDTKARTVASPLPRPWMRGAATAVSVLVMGYLIIGNVVEGTQAQAIYGAKRPKPPLYGLYDVETVIADGEAVPPLLTDPDRWRHVIIEREGLISAWHMTGEKVYYGFQVDESDQSFVLTTSMDPLTQSRWTYEQPEPGRLVFEGELEGEMLRVEMKARPRDQFLLVDRRFRWISEAPFNR